jgi:hypothetical protein
MVNLTLIKVIRFLSKLISWNLRLGLVMLMIIVVLFYFCRWIHLILSFMS